MMPEILKVAELVPALKKHDADHEQFSNFRPISNLVMVSKVIEKNTRAKRLRMRKVSIFKLAFANANFTTRMPVFEQKSNFIGIQNFKAGNVKPPGMHWSKDF